MLTYLLRLKKQKEEQDEISDNNLKTTYNIKIHCADKDTAYMQITLAFCYVL